MRWKKMRQYRPHGVRARAILAAGLLGTAGSSGALATDWNNVAGGIWSVPGNWNGGIPTAIGSDAIFNLNTSGYTVNVLTAAVANSVVVNTDIVTLNVSSTHQLTLSANLLVGTGGSVATLNLPGAGTISAATGGATVDNPSDTLAVSGGVLTLGGSLADAGTFNETAGAVSAGSANFSSASGFSFTGGTLTVNGGAFSPKLGSISFDNGGSTSTYTSSSAISGTTGSLNRPTLRLNSGAALTPGTNAMAIGNSGGLGGVAIDGAGSSLAATSAGGGYLFVGAGRSTLAGTSYASDGALALTNGGQASSAINTYIGDHGGTGSATVDGLTSNLTASGQLLVGSFRYIGGSVNMPGSGNLALTNGGKAVGTGGVYIGISGGSGVATVDGVGSTITSSDVLAVGYSRFIKGLNSFAGTGSIALTNGGQVIVAAETDIGSIGSTGTASVDGLGSKFTAGGSLVIGSNQFSTVNDTNGQFTVQNNGVAQSGATSTDVALIGAEGGIGTMTVTGSGSTWTHTGNAYVGTDQFSSGGTGTLTVTNSGLASISGVLTVADNSTTAVNLTGGTLQIGSLATSGNPSRVNWTAGTLAITGSGGFSIGAGAPLGASLTIGAGKTLSVSNVTTNTGTFTVSTGGTFTAGGNFNNTGTANIGGTQNWSAGTTFTNTSPGTASFNSDAGSSSASPLTIHVISGSVALNTAQHLQAINIDAGSVTATDTAHPGHGGAGSTKPQGIIRTRGLTIGSTAVLNLGNNDFLWDYTAGTGPATFQQTLTFIENGFGSVTHVGGIYSTTIDPGGPTTDMPFNNAVNTKNSWEGLTGLTGTQVVVKFTYRGDANLDGQVNGSDYLLVDSGQNAVNADGFEGDANLDGITGGSDYLPVDSGQNNGVGNQLVAFSQRPTQTGPAVPEPGGLLALGLASGGLVARRRRSP